ncbi:MAG: hypothetical protein KAI66_27105 [Lentisphaeria bacterium]|nr:hypothetical protein [Lentisphaeria bacterium]
MIERECPCCQELFTPNKYHPEQVFCSKPGCRRASHAAANRKWRAAQRLHDPLAESQRKRRARSGRRLQLSRELSGWRRQLARQQMLLLGMLGLLAGTTCDDLAATISHCLDAGRELLRAEASLWEDVAGKLCPGFGFSEGESRDMASATC